MSTSPPADCRYNVDVTNSSSSIVLPDGRTLGYAEYGSRSPTSTPILYMPGFPSCRIEGAGLGPEALELNARIIAIDRPAYGLSSPRMEHTDTVLDHAKDVAVLVDHLKLERYGVLGISGGGPYALACAQILPNVKAVSLVCGLGSPDMGYWGMRWLNWAGWTFGQRLFPGLARWWFSREPTARLDLDEAERMRLFRHGLEQEKMHPKDLAMFMDESWQWMRIRCSAEVYKQGMDGMSQDFRVLNSEFGFKIEEIRKDLPVQIWHGQLDVMVPLQHAQKIKARLGDNAILRVSDDTHASIWQNRREEFLRELVEAVNA